MVKAPKGIKIFLGIIGVLIIIFMLIEPYGFWGILWSISENQTISFIIFGFLLVISIYLVWWGLFKHLLFRRD